jgi:hypothetical protein
MDSSILFDIELSSWLEYCMLASQGFINMSSSLLLLASWLLYLASWIQGFFTWLHGFNTQKISRIIYLTSWIQDFFTWLHGFKASSLGFMASILKQSPFFTFTSSSSLLHPYHYCEIFIIIASLKSMTTFFEHINNSKKYGSLIQTPSMIEYW